MLSFWPGKKRLPIALDLGGESIKMLQMHKTGGTVSVRACKRWQMPAGDHLEPPQRHKLAVSAVREMLRSGGFQGRRVVTALSCRQLAIRNVRLPHRSEKEMDIAVRQEAQKLFKFNLEPDRLHYLNAGQVRQGNDTSDEIIMLAVTREQIDAHLKFLSDAGLVPVRIDAEPVAVFRAFERLLRRRADEQAVSVVLDIGWNSSRIVVARGRSIVFIKDISVGGQKLNEAAARQLNLSLAEACELRQRVMRHPSDGGEDDSQNQADQDAQSVNWVLRDAARSELEALAKEIALCLRYCTVTFRGLRPQCVTLTGGEAYDPSVAELLSEYLNIPCVVGHPLKGIDVSAVDLGTDRRVMLAEWAVCAGLAIRDLDLKHTMPEMENGQDRLSA